MAENTKNLRDTNWHWTNERHLHFLTSMEASFVRTMFETNCRCPPLDRYVPDISDSTEDLGKESRRRSCHVSGLSGRKRDQRTRTSSHNLSQDQVVPQFQNRGDDKDKDEKYDLDVSFGTAN